MSIFNSMGKRSPKITEMKKLGKSGSIKSGIIFGLKNGLGKLYTVSSEVEGDYVFNSKLMLGDTPLVQYIDPMCPTCMKLISAGYGIENTDCEELRQIRDSVNADFVSIEKSFEILSPLLGILEDGYYLLADTECFPTDGGRADEAGTFFWGTDPKRRGYKASCDTIYIGEADGCLLFSAEDIPPSFLYPTQSADRYDPERAQYYRSKVSGENAPRAIAYDHLSGMSALLDGHHKAAAAALNGQAVKTLVIVPLQYIFKDREGREKALFTGDIGLTREEAGEKLWQDIVTDEEKNRRDNRLCPKVELTAPRFTTRQWERVFEEKCAVFPSAEMLAMERCFGIDTGFEEMVGYLSRETAGGRSYRELFFEDRFGFGKLGVKLYAEELGLKLLLKRAGAEGDKRLRDFALSAARHAEGYALICAALQYLMAFRGDKEVERLCIDIISEPDMYTKFGDIVVDFRGTNSSLQANNTANWQV